MQPINALFDQNPLQELQANINAMVELPLPSPTSKLAHYINRKSNWTPAQYNPIQLPLDNNGFSIAVLKALALTLALEVPVGEYTLAASKQEFTPEEKWALLDNANDEITHFTALRNFATQLSPADQKLLNLFAEEAQYIAKVIQEQVEHTIVKSGYIELSVFLVILSLLRKFGPAPIKIMVANISKDESVHVQTNWAIIDAHGIPYTDSKLNEVRQHIIDWVTGDISSRRWGLDFWMQQSDSLITNRQASGLEFTKSSMSIAFFEVDNRSLAAY